MYNKGKVVIPDSMTWSDLGVVTPLWPGRQSDAGHLPSLMAGTHLRALLKGIPRWDFNSGLPGQVQTL